MATVSYSVPDEVKARFNAAFAGRNKSQIIALLMTRAAEDEERRVRRARAMARIEERRSARPASTDEQVRAARAEGRA